MRMNHRLIPLFLALFAASGLAACGGGKSSSTPLARSSPSPVPTPTAGPTTGPQCTTLSAQTSGSTYTLTSSPTGITVQRVDPSVTTQTCVYFTGITQTTDVPQTAPHPWNYVFAPQQTTPYVVSIAQQLNGNHTLFYNQTGDSSGSISTSSLQSLRRTSAIASAVSGVTQRGLHRFTGTGVASGQVLVRYRGTATQMRARSLQIASAEGVTSGPEITTVGGTYERYISVPAGTDSATFAASLRTQSDVVDVFPTHLRFPLGKPALTVSDPHANNVDQWYLFADGFPNAWSYSNGGLAKIAMIDTGIDLNNTDLAGANYVGGQSIYRTSSTCSGTPVTNSTPQDTNGHGTNTAGVAAAATNNALGFAGAGFNVKLLAYDIFPDATASSDQQSACVSDEVQAIQTAVAAGADVISMSLGAAQDFGSDNGFDQGEHDAVEAAIAAGVTVVAAAGNDADGGESGTPHTVLDYPAGYDGVISVGASALRDNNSGVFAGSTEYVASYSQYGPGLSVVAPGGDPSGNDSNPLHWVWNYSTSTAAFGSGPGNGDKCKTPSPAKIGRAHV